MTRTTNALSLHPQDCRDWMQFLQGGIRGGGGGGWVGAWRGDKPVALDAEGVAAAEEQQGQGKVASVNDVVL